LDGYSLDELVLCSSTWLGGGEGGPPGG
jgi:hypothetical protein